MWRQWLLPRRERLHMDRWPVSQLHLCSLVQDPGDPGFVTAICELRDATAGSRTCLDR